MINKIHKSKCNKFPANLFIILDDAASSDLISQNDAPIINQLKVFRHLHLGIAICVQTVRDSIKDLKMLRSDVVLYRHLTDDDLEQVIKAIPTSHTLDELLPLYNSLKEKYGKII
ncbi:MAG: hypothetical protein Ta2E_10530 [Mycoplasmoidaceae bacterium]|nr:MAG: hypothetical protein Ta2E_10530 [Mycoplasmoidaceae bacterium]